MSDEKLGRDLRLRIDGTGADLAVDKSGDLATIEGIDNLAQAIICRLSTAVGEMEELGHSGYGSRLSEVLGQPRTERSMSLIHRAVESSLAGERRIRELVSVTAIPDRDDPGLVTIEITIIPASGGGILSIRYPFHLEVA
ncbi:MAG: hypothetical protein ABC537_00855 [Candidatus Methanosuratincola sp.]